MDNQLNQMWLEDRIHDIGLEKAKFYDKWYYDQWVTTFGILKQRLCSVPNTSGLWKVPGLVEKSIYFSSIDDSKTCWHGNNYHDCNRARRLIPSGCKWWHFYPQQPFEDHVKKFNELTNNTYRSELSMLQNMLGNEMWQRNRIEHAHWSQAKKALGK